MDKLKKCNKCDRELPMTKGYFWKNRNCNDGFQKTCKECSGWKFTKLPKDPKAGYKICTRCNKELPATTDFFTVNRSTPSGLYSLCKKCKSKVDFEYRQKNKEKIAENDKGYYEANKEKIKEYRLDYYNKNFDKISAKNKEYYEENKEEIKEKTKIYAINNPQKVRKWKKKWQDNNQEYLSVKRHIRRANKAKTEHSLTLDQWEQCLEFFNYKDAYTGLPMEVISQDHIIPISKGGPYTRDNIVPCEININCSKQDSDMEEWFRKQPFFNKERLNRIYEWVNLDKKKNKHPN